MITAEAPAEEGVTSIGAGIRMIDEFLSGLGQRHNVLRTEVEDFCLDLRNMLDGGISN